MSDFESPEPAFDEAEADRRLTLDRRDIVAMLAKADNRMQAGDHRAANAYYGQVGQLAREGQAIDRSELSRARDATMWLADRFKSRMLEGLATRGVTSDSMHPRFAKSLAIMLGERQRDPVYQRFPQAPRTYFYPDLPYVQFADPAKHSWISAIESETRAILAEVEPMLAAGSGFSPYVKANPDRPQGDVHGLLEDSSWSTFSLTEKGEPDPDRIALCPRTHSILSRHAPLCKIPNRAPSPMFSLLRAGARIPPHTGMINARFVCHLPLIVPGAGALRVGEQRQQWQFGKVMLFDDTVEHEAWNEAQDDRLVLIFDVWRPELEQIERDQIATLFSVVDEY